MNSNEIHHIVEEYKNLKNDKKDKLLRLIQLLFSIHPELFTNNSSSIHFFETYSMNAEENGDGNCELSNVSVLTDFFYDFNVFMELLRLMTKTAYVKKMSKIMKEIVNNEDKLEKMRETFNTIILINLIQRRLEKKTHNQISHYQLFEKINEIESGLNLNLVTLLSIKDNDISKYIIERYNYTNCFEILHSHSVRNHYFSIYYLFSHFL